MRSFRLLATLLITLGASASLAQEIPSYSFRRSISAFNEYSNTSSHIILGVSRNRQVISVGFAVSQRLLHSRYLDWYYTPEVLPLVMIQDPVATQTISSSGSIFSQTEPTAFACKPTVENVPPDPAIGFPGYIFTRTCSSRWSYAGGLSPLGQRVNLMPRSRIQAFVTGNAGFLVSPHDIPVNDSSRFNFTFEFGGGIEFFRDKHHSWTAEYRIHHTSNAYIGDNNPGIDSQLIKLTYTIGR